jgi:AraC-like DNA-binding protein
MDAIAGERIPDDAPRRRGLSLQQRGAALEALYAALDRTLADERDAAEACLRRAAEILRAAPPPPPASAPAQGGGGLAPWQVRKVTAHIEAHLDAPIRSADLAALVRLNPCHFSRTFRRSFGSPPLDYVIRRRIERAQRLMLATDAPLSRIALDCGLADQAHLSRLFRRVVGESPAAWRRARIDPDAAARVTDAARGAPPGPLKTPHRSAFRGQARKRIDETGMERYERC